MKYKGDFVGLQLKEEKALIRYIVNAYTYHKSLSEPQLFLLGKSLRIMSDNQEFKRTTLDELLALFYNKLQFDHLSFQGEGKRGGFLWGGWYDIPKNNPEIAAKRLKNRIIKRRRNIDAAWFHEFDETFDWQSLHGLEQCKESSKELIKKSLGGRVEEIAKDRDPESAVIIPFNKP